MFLSQGVLESGTVAVKRLSDMCMDEKKFHGEVQCLMKARHKNIVRFLGYCADTQGNMLSYNGKLVMADVRQRLLCFEYMPKGSLRDYISGRDMIFYTIILFWSSIPRICYKSCTMSYTTYH